MERYLKVAIVGAVGAFILSVLTGVLAGVGFGTVLIRGLLAALLFGAGAVGLRIAVEKVLPDLLSSNTERSGGNRGSDSEGRQSGSASPSAGGRLNIVVEDDAAADGYGDEDSGETDDENGLVEEVEEQGVDDEEAVMESVIAEESERGNSGFSGDELDEIPDIGGFAGSFVSAGDDDDEASTGTEDSSGSGEGTVKKNSGNDPAQIAKALRTMMNRDE